MKTTMTSYQLRQAINETISAMRAPIIGAKLPDEVAAELSAHLSTLMEVERTRAAALATAMPAAPSIPAMKDLALTLPSALGSTHTAPLKIDPVVEANRSLLHARSQVGIRKYGVTLGDAALSAPELIKHALEETLDLANYLQALSQAGAGSLPNRKPVPEAGEDAPRWLIEESNEAEGWNACLDAISARPTASGAVGQKGGA